jgi:hypothetical protein
VVLHISLLISKLLSGGARPKFNARVPSTLGARLSVILSFFSGEKMGGAVHVRCKQGSYRCLCMYIEAA